MKLSAAITEIIQIERWVVVRCGALHVAIWSDGCYLPCSLM